MRKFYGKCIKKLTHKVVIEEGVLHLLIKIDYSNDTEIQKDKLNPTTSFHVCTLVSGWIDDKIIESACAIGKSYLEEDLKDYFNQALKPRVTEKKKTIVVECMFDIKTIAATYQLCQIRKLRVIIC